MSGLLKKNLIYVYIGETILTIRIYIYIYVYAYPVTEPTIQDLAIGRFRV